MESSNKGQMRVIEAMLACMILVIGIVATTYFSSVYTVEEGGDLEKTGQNLLATLSNTNLIRSVVLNEPDSNWESNLQLLMKTLIPPDVFYTLTIASGLIENKTYANITNMAGQEPSLKPDEVSLRQTVTISLPIAKDEKRKLDVILIVDRSGSMEQESKIYYAKQAATTFVDTLNASKDRVGLVSFSTHAILDSGLTTDFLLVKTKINNLYANGWTNIGDAIKELNDEFQNNGRSDALHAMILLTDGVANRPCPHYPQHVDTTCPTARQYALDESNVAKSRDVLIYTIGLGSSRTDFDEELLRTMQTNGYYYAPSGKDLMDIYLAISRDLLYTVSYDIVLVTLTLIKAG